MNNVGRIGTAQVSAFGDTISKAVREPLLWLGLGLFGFSALFWLVVLSRVPLSVAYPFAGLSYIVIVFLDHFVLDDRVPALRWVGAAVIAVGIAIIGISSRTIAGK
jgi:drug/metabolite transporter (DMT)-like permease